MTVFRQFFCIFSGELTRRFYIVTMLLPKVPRRDIIDGTSLGVECERQALLLYTSNEAIKNVAQKSDKNEFVILCVETSYNDAKRHKTAATQA